MWQFYSNAQFGEDLLVTRVQGQDVSFSAALINQLLGTSEDGIFSFNELHILPLSEKALSAEEWLLHRFSVYHLVGRSGSLNTLSSEDLILVSTLHQGIYSFNEVQILPLSEKALSAKEWLLHRFSVYHLVGRSGSLNTLSSEDLILVSTLHQGIRLNFRRFMMERIQFLVDKIL